MSPAARSPHFRPALFAFLRDLRQNNDRDWFQANKARYLEQVREPAQQFISDFSPHLGRISGEFSADPRPNRGSLFRIHRDVRFSKDKSPYKTYAGIQFRHRQGRDAHAPGFYLHLEPGSVFAGIGIWHPDSATARGIRDAIAADPRGWKRAVGGTAFSSRFELAGDSLKRPPRGYPADHPLIEDLKRKDFIAVAKLTQKEATAADFLDRYVELCRTGKPLISFLCQAVGVPF